MTDEQIKDLVVALINNGRIANTPDWEKNVKEVAKAVNILNEKID